MRSFRRTGAGVSRRGLAGATMLTLIAPGRRTRRETRRIVFRQGREQRPVDEAGNQNPAACSTERKPASRPVA